MDEESYFTSISNSTSKRINGRLHIVGYISQFILSLKGYPTTEFPMRLMNISAAYVLDNDLSVPSFLSSFVSTQVLFQQALCILYLCHCRFIPTESNLRKEPFLIYCLQRSLTVSTATSHSLSLTSYSLVNDIFSRLFKANPRIHHYQHALVLQIIYFEHSQVIHYLFHCCSKIPTLLFYLNSVKTQ